MSGSGRRRRSDWTHLQPQSTPSGDQIQTKTTTTEVVIIIRTDDKIVRSLSCIHFLLFLTLEQPRLSFGPLAQLVVPVLCLNWSQSFASTGPSPLPQLVLVLYLNWSLYHWNALSPSTHSQILAGNPS